MNKNPFLALVLGLIPGLGHLYLKKFGRFILYSGGAVFLFIFAVFCTIALGARDIAFLSSFTSRNMGGQLIRFSYHDY